MTEDPRVALPVINIVVLIRNAGREQHAIASGLDMNRIDVRVVPKYLFFIIGVFSNLNLNCVENKKIDPLNSSVDDYFIKTNIESKISFFDVFSKIECIPIIESNFKIGKLGQFIVHDSAIFIIDKSNMSIIKVNNAGNPEVILNKKGEGPGEYSFIGDFDINIKTNEISILEPWGLIYKYDISGNYLNKYKLNIPGGLHFIKSYSNYYYLYSQSEPKKVYKYVPNSIGNYIYDDSPFYFRKTLVTTVDKPFFLDENKLYYYHPGWDIIYTLHETTSEPYIRLNLNPGQFDYSQFRDDWSVESATVESYFKNNPSKVWMFGYVYIFNEVVIGSYRMGIDINKYIYIDKFKKPYSFKRFTEGVEIPFSKVYKYNNHLFALIEVKSKKELADNSFFNRKVLSTEQLNKLSKTNNFTNYIIVRYSLK